MSHASGTGTTNYKKEASIRELCQLSLFLWMLFFVTLLLYKVVQREYCLFISMVAWILTSFLVYSPSPNLLVRYKIAKTLNSIYSTKGPTTVWDGLVGDVLCSYSFLWREIDYLFFNIRRPFINITGLSSPSTYKESILCPFLSFIPSMIRIKQCLLDYSITKDNVILINICKYLLGFPVLYWMFKWNGLGVLGKTYVILMLEISTLFNVWWDVCMDWKADSRDKRMAIKGVIFCNFIARHCWIICLGYDCRLFYIQLIEVIRRFVWLHYRLPHCYNSTTSTTTNMMKVTEMQTVI